MGTDILKILSVFLLSAVKFGLGGVPAAVFANFGFFKAMLVTISGGMCGVVVFTYLSEWINNRIKKAALNKPKVPKKKFTFTNKLIVRVKKYFGLIGIAAITPILLSIPIGVFLAIRYYKDKGKVIRFMLVAIVGWAVALYYILHTFRSLF